MNIQIKALTFYSFIFSRQFSGYGTRLLIDPEATPTSTEAIIPSSKLISTATVTPTATATAMEIAAQAERSIPSERNITPNLARLVSIDTTKRVGCV